MKAAPGGRRRRGRAILLALGVALGAVLLLRRELAGPFLRRALVARGVPVESLTVAALGLHEARLRDLRLLHGIVSIDELVLRYEPAGLRRSRLDSVEARGVAIRWTGSEEPIDLQALLRHAPRDLEQAAQAIRALGALRLVDARVEVLTRSEFGRIEARLDGGIDAAAGGGFRLALDTAIATPIGRLDGRLRCAIGPDGGLEGVWEVGRASYASALAQAQAGLGRVHIRLLPSGELSVEGAVTLGPAVLPAGGIHLAGGGLAIDVRDDRLALDFEASVAGADLALRARLAARELFAVPEVDLEVEARARGQAALACLGLDGGAEGALEATLRLGGVLGERGERSLRAYAVRHLAPQVRLAARGLRLAAIEGIAGTLAARLVEQAGEVHLQLDEEARLEAGEPAPRRLRLPAAGANDLAIVPDEGGFRIAGPVALALEEGAGRHRAQGRLEARLDGGLRLREAELRDLVVELSRASFAGRTLAHLIARGGAGLRDGRMHGRLELEAGTAGPDLRIRAAVEGEGDAEGAVLRLAGPARIEGQPLAGVELSSIEVRGEARLRLPSGLDSARIEVALARASLPGRAVEARGIAARLELRERWSGEVVVEQVSETSEPPLVAPFALRLALTGPGPSSAAEPFRFAGAATVAAAPPIAVSGWFEPEGRVQVALDTGVLEFRPGALEPRQLLPRLQDLRVHRGSARLTAAWPAGSARLEVNGLDAQMGAFGLIGLDLSLALDSIDPPASPGAQRLHVGEVETALGKVARDLDLCFQVLPGEPLRLLVERLAAGVPGGRVSARDLLLDPAAEETLALLEVDRLDLGELFRRLEVEGLEGEGIVAGQVPLRLDGEGLSIAGARLDSLGPGVLRYRSERVKELLAGNGEWVDLMVEALRDFRYELLEARVPAAGGREVKLALKLSGHNPNVLEGHPLIVNIAVDGRLQSLLAALSEGYRLQRELLWRSLRGRR